MTTQSFGSKSASSPQGMSYQPPRGTSSTPSRRLSACPLWRACSGEGCGKQAGSSQQSAMATSALSAVSSSPSPPQIGPWQPLPKTLLPSPVPWGRGCSAVLPHLNRSTKGRSQPLAAQYGKFLSNPCTEQQWRSRAAGRGWASPARTHPPHPAELDGLTVQLGRRQLLLPGRLTGSLIRTAWKWGSASWAAREVPPRLALPAQGAFLL